MDKKDTIRELGTIPGVGKSIAQDLIDLNIHHIADLKEKDPEKLYKQLCDVRGAHIDRCMLYVFRCATYFAREKNHDPKKLLWWNWKDS